MDHLPLEGLKVADFGHYGVGPWICRHLANHGAEVVRVESTTNIDGLRTSPPYKGSKIGVNRAAYFTEFNTDKYGITLNLRHSLGIKVAKRIMKWADVVVENHSPGVMTRLGLGYEDLKEINPEIIMLSASAQGQSGPYSSHPSLGTQLSALAGFVFLTGWPDRDPVPPFGAYTDAIIPQFGVVAILAALEYKRRTGEGLYIDISQFETSIQFLAPLMLDFIVNHRIAQRNGNCWPSAAPHGVYRCKGEDRWCAISVLNEEEWQCFCSAMGNPEWAGSPLFATLAKRKQNEEELDRLVENWTIQFTAEQVMCMMQAVGVPAGVVQTCEDLSQDPQLKYRQHFTTLVHPEIGEQNYDKAAFKLSATPTKIRRPAPCLGEHNEHFYTKVLGIPDDEFIQLLSEGAFE